MPGHKGRGPLGCEAWDLTEIAGADELYEAEGIIAQSEANTARLFGSAGTFYGTEGSSQCIRAMLFLALQAAPAGQGRPVLLAARNAHKALLYAAALLDFDIRWLWPPGRRAGRQPLRLPGVPGSPGCGPGRVGADGEQPLRRLPDQPRLPGRDAGCRGLWPLSVMPIGRPCWWITPMGPTCGFCPGAAATPWIRGRTCAATRPTRPLPVLTGGGLSAPGARPAAARTGGSAGAPCACLVPPARPI